MILILILFAIGLFIGIKIAKSTKKPISKEEEPIEVKVVKEPIKAIKVAGIKVDIKELKEKSSHFCEGLKHIIEIER